MKRETQAEKNPFPYTDSNKRYHTYDYAMRIRYGGKCAKAVLDAGFTCPNIDGTKGKGGCIYCSGRGSGDFADPTLSLRAQYEKQRKLVSQKWTPVGWIPYLQAHTNTYAPLERLREVYEEVLSFPDIVGMSIATRGDCITEEIGGLLAEVAEKTDLTVELGLQSVWDETATRINRCHTYEEFLQGFRRLRQASDRIRIGVHLINGLPGESAEQMLETVRLVGELHPEEVKLHLLHVLKGTALATLYEAGEYTPMAYDDYVTTVVDQLERLPADIVVGRITGDAPGEDLLAPLWSKKKLTVMNGIDKLLLERDSWQGKYAKI